MIRIDERRGLLTLGERLAEVREQAAMTQQELACRAGLTQQQVSRMETGGRLQRSSVTILKALADAMDVDVRELVRRTPLEHALVDEPVDEDTGRHLAYCPNPLCSRNRIHASPVMTYRIEFKSLQVLGRDEWAQLEFCGHCGSRLIKTCPHCGKRVRQAPEYFCSRCGKHVDDRPDDPERELLARLYGRCDHSFPPRRPRRPRRGPAGVGPPGEEPAGQEPPEGDVALPPGGAGTDGEPVIAEPLPLVDGPAGGGRLGQLAARQRQTGSNDGA